MNETQGVKRRRRTPTIIAVSAIPPILASAWVITVAIHPLGTDPAVARLVLIFVFLVLANVAVVLTIKKYRARWAALPLCIMLACLILVVGGLMAGPTGF